MRRFVLIVWILFLCALLPKFVNAQMPSSNVTGILFSLDKLSTEEYYYCNISDSLYYIKFDKIQDDYAEGFYFIVNKSVFADVKTFQITKINKKYLLVLEDRKLKVKSDFIVGKNKIIGRYAVDNRFLKIFRNYKWSDYFEVKMHKPSTAPRFLQRFKEKVFDDIIVKSDIVYGNAEGYWDSYPLEDESYFEILTNGVKSTINKRELDLKLDIYMPKSDTLEKRPLIVFIHGGGFYIGDKKTTAMVEWCKYFAKMGYVTVSLNYRLGFKPVGPSIQRSGYRALLDAHAAMRFLVSNAEKYGIDTDMIIVGGTSAGAITALNLTYMRNQNRPEATRGSFFYDDLGDIEKSGNSIKRDLKINTVINMWGAVNELEMLKNSDASIISFHGDADKVVPINYDYPFQDIKGHFSSIVMDKMYGSLLIHLEEKKLGRREKLNIIESAGHSPHVDENDNLNDVFDFISVEIRDFLYDELIPNPCEIVSKPATPFNRAMLYYETTSTDYKEINWEIVGGVITGQKNNIVRVAWFDTATEHKLTITGRYENGAGFIDEYEF